MRCVHCGEPIRRVHGGWVHDGPGGGYPCRDRRCGMWMDTMAAPAPAPDWPVPPAVGRHAVGIAPGSAGQHPAGA